MRVPSLKQPLIREIVRVEGLDSRDEVQLLRRFGRKTISNPFELVEERECPPKAPAVSQRWRRRRSATSVALPKHGQAASPELRRSRPRSLNRHQATFRRCRLHVGDGLLIAARTERVRPSGVLGLGRELFSTLPGENDRHREAPSSGIDSAPNAFIESLSAAQSRLVMRLGSVGLDRGEYRNTLRTDEFRLLRADESLARSQRSGCGIVEPSPPQVGSLGASALPSRIRRFGPIARFASPQSGGFLLIVGFSEEIAEGFQVFR